MQKQMMMSALASLFCCLHFADGSAAADPEDNIFRRDNLVAWCIVPFDASHRSPAERAEMLVKLGIKRVAYDWRKEHVASFEDEILQYRKHGLEYFAFWNWHDDMAPLVRKHGIRPQFWKTNPSPDAANQSARVAAAATLLQPMVERTDRLNCKLGLYNHGGWGGQPENLVAVCRHLRNKLNADHVGIVYNFHHGHDHVEGFKQSFELMRPYLLCVNINGMLNAADVVDQNTKIVDVGAGHHERMMLRVVRTSGYNGPIGILDHRNDLDAQVSLQRNLDGLAKVIREDSLE